MQDNIQGSEPVTPMPNPILPQVHGMRKEVLAAAPFSIRQYQSRHTNRSKFDPLCHTKKTCVTSFLNVTLVTSSLVQYD